MVVQRNTFIPKRGQQEKVVELIKAGKAYAPFDVPYRIYFSEIGPSDLVVFELEFKDMAEYERMWSGWSEKVPESFRKAWNDATENGGSNEIWRLVD